MISIEECKHIEDLSKFSFSDSERAEFIKDFDTIVKFASTINKVELNTNKRYINSMKFEDLREDVVGNSLLQEQVTTSAPIKKKGCFVVPKIMD